MINFKIFLIFIISSFHKMTIIKSLESIEVDGAASLRNNRQLYQMYASTKYTIPNRQKQISNGLQSYTTSHIFPSYQYSRNQQSLPFVKPVINQNVNHNLQASINTGVGGGKFIFPDSLETSFTIKQTAQEEQQKQHQQQLHQKNHQNKHQQQHHNRQVLGSSCRRNFDQRTGYCLFAHQCLHIVREFRLHGIKLDICSYQENLPVICCPSENGYDIIDDEDVKRLSAKKCAEYNNLEINLLKQSRRIHHSIKKCERSVPLIVGGEETVSGEYPHMAAIGWIRERGQINWACGGTLISEIYILTAAHCTRLGGQEPDRVKLGAQNINAMKRDANIQEFHISKIIIHPKYNRDEYYNDIALLKLNRMVKFSKYVKPACLWFRSNMNDIEIVTATGWGRTRYLGPKSEKLLKVDLKIIAREKCNELYEREIKLHDGITGDQFCAGYLEGGKDTCQGDSGGPINVQMGKYNCVNYVIGITSFGKFCAAPNSPGVYTKINSYLDWIENNVFEKNIT